MPLTTDEKIADLEKRIRSCDRANLSRQFELKREMKGLRKIKDWEQLDDLRMQLKTMPRYGDSTEEIKARIEELEQKIEGNVEEKKVSSCSKCRHLARQYSCKIFQKVSNF